MRKALPLLLAVVSLASGGRLAAACPLPDLRTLVAMSDHVALVRIVARHDVEEVRVIEYEVLRAFKGTPPARFAMIDELWGTEEKQADVPTPTDSAVLFLFNDPSVRAPWRAWKELARLTDGLAVLGANYAEPVLLWRDQVGMANAEAEEMMNALLKIVDPEAPRAYGVVPLETYLETLAAAVEQAAREPQTDAQGPGDGQEARTPR
jgi:hypothetical protein